MYYSNRNDTREKKRFNLVMLWRWHIGIKQCYILISFVKWWSFSSLSKKRKKAHQKNYSSIRQKWTRDGIVTGTWSRPSRFSGLVSKVPTRDFWNVIFKKKLIRKKVLFFCEKIARALEKKREIMCWVSRKN